MTDTQELLDKLDENTCLRVEFEISHADCYVYRFPSGIMVAAWEDGVTSDGIIRMDSEYVLERLEADGVEKVIPVPFWTTPFDEESHKPPSAGGCWICHYDDGDLKFNQDFDTYYHQSCLEESGCENLLEYEREESLDNEFNC